MHKKNTPNSLSLIPQARNVLSKPVYHIEYSYIAALLQSIDLQSKTIDQNQIIGQFYNQLRIKLEQLQSRLSNKPYDQTLLEEIESYKNSVKLLEGEKGKFVFSPHNHIQNQVDHKMGSTFLYFYIVSQIMFFIFGLLSLYAVYLYPNSARYILPILGGMILPTVIMLSKQMYLYHIANKSTKKELRLLCFHISHYNKSKIHY